MKNKNKFHLTPQAYNAIKEAAKALPEMARTNPDGSPMYRLTNEFKGTTNFDSARGSYTKNSQKYKELVLINHEVEMCETFKKFGNDGIKKYIEIVHELNNKNKPKKVVATIKIKCDTCNKIHELGRTNELKETTKHLTCNWCPECEDKAEGPYEEVQHETELTGS